MIKILIIGKRGFLGNSLYNYLKKNNHVKQIGFKNLNKFKKNINKNNYIINTSINKNYIKKKYNEKFDNDLKISKLINENKTSYIFLSTRKIYKSIENIKENSKLSPKINYSKNKLITEKKLIKKFNTNIIILRISNIIGDRSSFKKLHSTFVDIFFRNIKKGFIIDNKKDFKDFIGIDKFCEIIHKIIQKKLKGIYNVSIGKKIYLNEIISWLNRYNKKKNLIKDKVVIDNDNFYLNNDKLMSKIKISNTKNNLKKFCLKLSKKKFT